jgi:hemoglobin
MDMSPIRRRPALLLLPALLAATLASGCLNEMRDAQQRAPAPQPTAAAKPAASASLYERLGGAPAITAVIEDFVGRLAADPLIRRRFEGANIPRLKAMLVEQVSAASGGPVKYTGGDMRTVHRGMGITDAEFDALVGDLVASLDKLKVPEREKSELLGALAPLRKDIVEHGPTLEERLARIETALARIESKLAAASPGPAPVPRPPSPPRPAAAAVLPPSPSAQPWTDDERRLAAQLIERYTAAQAKLPAEGEPRSELIGRKLDQTRFVSQAGDVFDLKDFEGKKRVVLVVLRGFAGQVCINCSSQTLALARKIEEFRARNAEVVLVYPGAAETLPTFLEAVRNLQEGFTPPFPVVLDVDLAAVRTFKIEGSLAKPTSMVIDEGGVVRWAYVGKQPADRPSAKDLLDQLDRLGAKK